MDIHCFNHSSAESVNPLFALLRGTQTHPVRGLCEFQDRNWLNLLQAHPEPIFVVDRDAHILYQNPAAAAFLRSWHWAPTLPPCLATLVKKSFGTETNYAPDKLEGGLLFQQDQERRFYLPRVTREEAPGSQPERALLCLSDLTSIYLRDEHKTGLITTASHEIKTPLASVRTAIYLLLEEALGALSPRQQELTRGARDDLDRALSLLNQILDLGSLEAGAICLHPQAVEPIDLIETVQAEVSELLRVKNLKFSVEMGPDLPPLLVDRQRILLSLRNFLTNAIKYSPVNAEITLRATAPSRQQVRFAVIDSGPGVPLEYQTRVFEKFFQIPGQSRSGSGLGLAIARQNVAAHKGEIGYRRAPGRGSEFFMVLPAG